LLKQHRPKLLAEALGAFALVFAGCGAIITDSVSGGRLTYLGVALTFGLTITVMIASLGHISGAHFNPAVTIALAARRYFPASLVAPYLIAQVVGALLAALMLFAFFGPVANLGATSPAGSPWQSFVLEIILTAILIFVIACVALDSKVAPGLPPLAIGGTVALEALFAGPISGASMNPARSLAPALFSGQLSHLWIYLIAPILGGLFGILLFEATRQESAQ
jgi:MIP family channel proteins